jgi:hypothetical protein
LIRSYKGSVKGSTYRKTDSIKLQTILSTEPLAIGRLQALRSTLRLHPQGLRRILVDNRYYVQRSAEV